MSTVLRKKHHQIDEYTSDEGAGFGHTKENKIFYGYKGYLFRDKHSEIITSYFVLPANKQKVNYFETPLAVESPWEVITSAKSFDIPQNRYLFKSLNIYTFILCGQYKNIKGLKRLFLPHHSM